MNSYEYLVWIFVATLGGTAKAINTILLSKEHKFQLVLIVSRAFVGAFSGYMFALAVGQVKPEWSTLAAGIGGWLGADGLSFLIGAIKDKFASYDLNSK